MRLLTNTKKYKMIIEAGVKSFKLQKMSKEDFRLFVRALNKTTNLSNDEMKDFFISNPEYINCWKKVATVMNNAHNTNRSSVENPPLDQRLLNLLLSAALLMSYPLFNFPKVKRLFSVQPPGTKFLLFASFLYSSRTIGKVFKPLVADWQEEYFEALFKKEIWKARWINVRYTYAFILAMWQKSLIGDLIEFISKLAK